MNEDDDGSASFALANQLGLGNAGEGDKYHFRFGGGDVDCVAGEGTAAQANVRVAYENGVTDENVFVTMVCSSSEHCSPPGGD